MHVAIIMDGNGRWATQRGLTRATGHQRGAKAVRDIVRAAAREPIDILTLYAFSSDNWSRPGDEVRNLMRLLKRHLSSETAECIDNSVQVSIMGNRDRLATGLLQTIANTEAATQQGTQLHLRLAIDYSGRAAIERAAAIKAADPDKAFPACLAEATHTAEESPPVDLLIRTGGEHRLSDFLLWESAYAELLFTDTYWPDFDEPAFMAALAEFERRERRFGGVPRVALREVGTA